MLKKVVYGVSRHGRRVFEGIFQKKGGAVKNGQKNHETVKLDGIQHHTRQPVQRPVPANVSDAVVPKNAFVRQLALYARKNLASELRRQFDRSPIYREYRGLASRLSMFAFVGVGFASRGSSEDERFGSICDQIKGIFQDKIPLEEQREDLMTCGLQNYLIGPMIAKGCNAAVYEARTIHEDKTLNIAEKSPVKTDEVIPTSDEESDIEVLDESEDDDSFEFVEQVEEQVPSFHLLDVDIDEESDISILEDENAQDRNSVMFLFSCQQDSVPHNPIPHDGNLHSEQESPRDFDLAIKIMFNYDVESNANALYREMEKELLPAKTNFDAEKLGILENGHRPKEKDRIPPHPNIVDMTGAFVDDMPILPEGREEYPQALPRRLDAEGFGRNKTLFLVMKRYPQTLRDYLQKEKPLSLDVSLSLFTQLVQAVVHLVHNGVAHRDLKSDNIFVDDTDALCPHLVVSDFGDCITFLADDNMRLPYNTREISKGGNPALMAPEIIVARPGFGSLLDYSKSDLWAVGTLAYEIFGLQNPFYRDNQGNRLSSATYREENLPSLPDDVPDEVNLIVLSMLARDPEQRPSPCQVSAMLSIMMWGPEEWFLTNRDSFTPDRRSLMRWILLLTAKTLCEKGLGHSGTQHNLRQSFLAHLDFDDIVGAVKMLWN